MRSLIIAVFCLLIFSCKEEKKEPENKDIFVTIPEKNSAYNLIKWKEAWQLGEGSINEFRSFGNENESRRIKGKDVDKNETVLWECIADTATNWDGGFLSKIDNIDHTKPYMFVAWVKKPKNNTARIYYAFDSVEEVTGEFVKNANFIGGGSKLSQLDSWYTLVGYIYPSNHKDDIEAEIYSGLYLNGEKTQEGRDFKWKENTSITNFRVVQVQSEIQGENLLISNPQLYVVDGTEPKLYELL